jgi:hypothetical protein
VIVSGCNCAFAAVTMLSIGKVGASSNHFLAWDVSTCLLCGLLLYRVLATWTLRRTFAGAVTPLYAVLLMGLLLPPTSLLAGLGRSPLTTASSKADDEVLEMIRQTPGPVFSENLLLVMQAGKRVEAEPATVTYLAQSGRWDERSYVGLFAEQYFSLLVVYNLYNRWLYTPAVASAIEQSYFLERQIGAYGIYRRRVSIPAPAPPDSRDRR